MSGVGAVSGGGGVSPCIHRSHNQLDELKTLKLDHNRLQSVVVSLTEGPALSASGVSSDAVSISSTGDASSIDDLSRSPVKVPNQSIQVKIILKDS